MKHFLLMLVVLFCCVISFGQVKDEHEKRIKKKDVPKSAVKWMKDAYEGKKKIKWYKETSDEKISYEAKLKWKNRNHSVEFSENGIIEDIEIVYKWEELNEDVKKNLISYFESGYNKYSVRKVQKQYTGSPDNLEDIIDENEYEDITVQYEIEYYGRTDSDDEMWEGLFSEQGKLISKKVFKIRPTDNLDF